jgi:hypothetical protein
MIKKSLKNNQYFINVTNIFHNLFNVLTTLRLILAQKTQLLKTLARKEKRKIEILNHYYGMGELHFHLAFQQSSYKCCSFEFDLYFIGTHHSTITILKNSFWSSLTTSLYVIPIHIRTRMRSCSLMITKSSLLRSLNGVYAKTIFKFLGP